MKYTIITGAASDIGQAICLKLIEEGHSLLMLDIDAETLSDFAKTLPSSGAHLYLKVDFSKPEESEKVIKDFIAEHSLEIRSAVFAAGIFAIKPLRMLRHDYFQKSIDIALYSVIQIMQIVTSKKINADNFEAAVIISSVSAKIGTKGYVLYSAVKASLLGMMHSLAAEFAPRIRINAIMPAAIKTRATAFIFNNSASVNTMNLLGEGHPEDIANLITFLLSEKSRWITGQEFAIDGGFLINR